MKKITLYIVSIFTMVMSGCTDLDQLPIENIQQEETFKTVEDAQAWTNGMYAALRENIRGAIVEAPEYQADLLNVTSYQSWAYNTIHTWDDLTTDELIIGNIWVTTYQSITNINRALEGFDNISDQESIKFNRGELYLARALHYSNLATLYCKAYDPATAQTDLGLPMIFKGSYTEVPSRSSLYETYSLILEDIAKAETLLSAKTNTVGSETFTPDAAKALKARVLLYMQNWKEAYDVSISLLNTYPLATSEEELKAIWYNDDTKESIVQLFSSSEAKEQGITLNYLGREEMNGEVTAYLPPVLPTQTFVDLYETADFRKNIFLKEVEVDGVSVQAIHKFPGNPDLKVGNSVSYAHKPKVFRIAEQYLIAAEAAYNHGDVTNAQKYLNLLKEARGATASAATGSDLLQEIKNERTRELAFEGFRLFDLKRWNQDVVRGTPQNEWVILDFFPEQYSKLNKPYTDYRLVWFIRGTDVELDPEKLKQNPGW